jgi:UDP:flavonoid glycosyltransferase YjiC (YdhE family)
MGTLAADLSADFHRRVLDALDALSEHVQGILVAPPEAIPGKTPGNVLIVPRAPTLELLGRDALDAVVCHAGLNTVTETLANRVPLVLAPIRHDQPVTAAQVVAAGAGIRVDFWDADPQTLRQAIESVLDDPGPRAAADRIAKQFLADGGAQTAAACLEELVEGATPGRTDIPTESKGDLG